jgi:AAA+ superfamily predicted ATPase
MRFDQVVQFLNNVVKHRLDLEINGASSQLEPFNFDAEESELSDFVMKNKLSGHELVVLFLALIPHVLPDFLGKLINDFLPNGGDYPDFGGVKGKNHRGMIPTGETVLFILAGNDIEKRLEVSKLFDESHLFASKNVLYLEHVEAGEPKMSGRLIMEEDYIDLFTTGKLSRPKLSADFPAQLITTELEWKDLVLNEKTLSEINEIETWLKYNNTLMNDWEMHGKIKPGYRVLFHGPPGTGKTMTACLLGKYTNRDVFRVDLSLVVSKYIGETEKNLSKLFDKAANKDWILFFDEADSIFGKRTNVRDAHDKYANQEVSYLLQRIEAHEGLVILASNMKSNIDTSFTRRFNSFIEFDNPRVEERLRLWNNYLPAMVQLDKRISLKDISRNFEITGANIVNAIHYAGLKTVEKESTTILYDDLLKGIQKEYTKEGKMIKI